MTEFQSKKKRSLVLPIAAAVIAIAVAGFVASRAGLDKALVKQQVDAFIVEMKEQGRAQGRDLDLTYADLEVQGGFSDKHVVMKEPVLTVKPLEPAPPQPDGAKKVVDALRITTPEVLLYPSASALTIKAAQSIDLAGVEEPEKSLLKVNPATPIEVTVANSTQGDVPYTDVTFASPAQIAFVYLRETQAEGQEEQTPNLVPVYETLTLTTAPGGGFTSSVAEDGSGLGKANLNFKDVVITPEKTPQGNIKLAEVTGNWSNTLNEKKLNVIKALVKVGPVTSDAADMPYQPLMLELDGTYEGAMPKSPEAVAGIQSPESVMTLKTFALTTKDASLKASGNFNANASDTLPVGTATLALTNVPYVLNELRKYSLLKPENEALVAAMLLKVTGTPVAELKDANIVIDRPRGGNFKVGAATFEELFAVLLQESMQQKAPAAGAEQGAAEEPQSGLSPQLPAADKPKATPIEVPDPSVRG